MVNTSQFRIVILEDNEFYNRVLTQRIKTYAGMLSFAFGRDYKFDVQSYTSSIDCISNLSTDTDIVFLDYFLDNKIYAADLLPTIREKCRSCKLVILSQTRNIGYILKLFSQDNVEFIYKDEEALSKSCVIIDRMVTGRSN